MINCASRNIDMLGLICIYAQNLWTQQSGFDRKIDKNKSLTRA